MRQLMRHPMRHMIFATLILIALGSDARATGRGNLEIVTANGPHRFVVEIVASQTARSRGLMFRRALAPDAGMLFDYQVEQPVSMWMKNTFIPLDMLFIAGDGRVVNIAQRTVPHSLRPIPSAGPVRAVLEVAAGTVDRLKIKAGDLIRHAIFSARPKTD